MASLRRFWAVAASRNSSFAPHGPRNRNRPSPRMRLRCAKSISTFFLSRIEIAYCLVFAISRATCRASSWSSRVILRASAFGQHFIFDGQAWPDYSRASRSDRVYRCLTGPHWPGKKSGSEGRQPSPQSWRVVPDCPSINHSRPPGVAT